MRLYFAYGSNLWKAGMQRRAPSARPLMAAVLENHTLTFESNEPSGAPEAFFANVRPADGSSVPGALYAIDDTALAALDGYEDVARGVYERLELPVTGANGKRTRALVYRMVLRREDPLREGKPSDDQLRQIREGYADWGLDLRVLARAMRWMPSTRS